MFAPLDTDPHLTNCKAKTRTPLNSDKGTRNTHSLLDRVLASKSDKIHAVGISASGPINPPSFLTDDLLVEHGREDSEMQQNANWLPQDASNNDTSTLIQAPRLQRRTTEGNPSRAEFGLNIALEAAGHCHRQTEGYEQAGSASSPTFVSPSHYEAHYPHPPTSKMIGLQNLSQPFSDQQHYAQPIYYQDSQQEQPQFFYLQPPPMQYSYSSHSSVCDGQEPMFTYPIDQQQSPVVFASMLSENARFQQTGYTFPIQSSDGSITPSVTADPSIVMGTSGGFFAEAPTMTISPTSLQRTAVNPEHSPLTSISDTESFAPHPADMDEVSRKRRMSSDEGNQSASLSGLQESSIDQSSASTRKRLRRERAGCPPSSQPSAQPPSHTGSSNATQSWAPAVHSADQTKATLADTLRKQLGMGKKKHAPPGGFKPWNTSPASSHLPSGSECINPVTGEVSLPNLENLTKEEIRKVKNRASAQRSRTRKSEQAFELRLENAKLMERLESLKQTLRESRPDLCVSMALDCPEPPLLIVDHGLSARGEELFSQDDEKSHMQMLIHGLRSQLDAERNQRVAAEQKISALQHQLESLSAEATATLPFSPSSPIAAKMTLDQVAERENAFRGIQKESEMANEERDQDMLRSLSDAPASCKIVSTPVQSRSIGTRRLLRSNGVSVKNEDDCDMTDPMVLPDTTNHVGLMFDMLIVMALLAMCAAMGQAHKTPAKPASPARRPAHDNRVIDAIQRTVIPSESRKQTIALTVLKPIIPSDDFERLSAEARSFAVDASDSDSALNKVVRSWLGQPTSNGAPEDPPKGWLIVASNSEKPTTFAKQDFGFWDEAATRSFMPDSDLFNTMAENASDAQLGADSSRLSSLFAPALWQKGPSPTLAPFIVEDPFADVDCASELSDLQSRTRASTVFDDQASSLLGSRRTSIHSTWPHDPLGMTRSASALPTTAAFSDFEKTSSTEFAKFEVEFEVSAKIVISSTQSRSAGPELLDRSQAAKLLGTGHAFPQQ